MGTAAGRARRGIGGRWDPKRCEHQGELEQPWHADLFEWVVDGVSRACQHMLAADGDSMAQRTVV
jgi:hypothetical protein